MEIFLDPGFSEADDIDIDGDEFLDTHSESETVSNSSNTKNLYFQENLHHIKL